MVDKSHIIVEHKCTDKLKFTQMLVYNNNFNIKIMQKLCEKTHFKVTIPSFIIFVTNYNL